MASSETEQGQGSTQGVRVGQRWQDRDRRSPNVVTVIDVTAGFATIQRPSKQTRVRISNLVRRFRLVSISSPALSEG